MEQKHDVKESKELILGLAKIIAIIVSKIEKDKKIGLPSLIEIASEILKDEEVSLAIKGINNVLPELKDLEAKEIAELLSVMIEAGMVSFKKIKE